MGPFPDLFGYLADEFRKSRPASESLDAFLDFARRKLADNPPTRFHSDTPGGLSIVLASGQNLQLANVLNGTHVTDRQREAMYMPVFRT